MPSIVSMPSIVPHGIATDELQAEFPIEHSEPLLTEALSLQSIANNLKLIFKIPSQIPALSYYLVDLPAPITTDDVVSQLPNLLTPNDVYKYAPYGDEAAGTIDFYVLHDMSTLNPVRLRASIRLGFGKTIPFDLARFVSASFASGLVASLMVSSFVSGLQLSDPFAVTGYNPLNTINDLDIAHRYFRNVSEQQFQVNIRKAINDIPFQAGGLLFGWQAGKLFSDFHGSGDTDKENAYTALWKLIRNRLTWMEIGQATSYCMSYLLGFLQLSLCAQIKQAAPQTKIDDVLSQIAASGDLDKVRALISAFYDAVLSPSVTDYKLGTDIRTSWVAFLRGFERGTLRATDDVFRNVFQLAYRIGYSDGYAKGYSDGWQDGYDAAKQTWFDRLMKLSDEAQQWYDKFNKTVQQGEDIVAKVAPIIAMFAG